MIVSLALIAALAVVGLILVGLSQRLPSQEQQGQNQHQPASQDTAAGEKIAGEEKYQANGWTKIKQAIERNEKVVTALSTAVIAAFTIALVLATGFLFFSSEKVADAAKDSAKAAQAAVELSDKTAERELRAYLSVTGFHITNLKVGEHIRAQIVLTNAGKTPAYHVKFNISTMGIRDFPAPNYVPAPTPPEPYIGGVPTAPNGGTFSISPVRALPLLSQEEFEAIKPNENPMGSAIYIMGVVSYIDAFNKLRTTRFYGAYGGQYGTNAIGAVAQMSEGNEAD